MAPSLRAKEGKLRAGLCGERGSGTFPLPVCHFALESMFTGATLKELFFHPFGTPPSKSAPRAVPKEHMVLQQLHIADGLNKERIINI
jgi:hypothetical protein